MRVSLYILTYNQAHVVSTAISGALAQTYSPLQIIISDDCSTDGTWAAIEEAVAEYRGPHTVMVRRNPVNMGVSGHINQVWRECTGDWIVASAGDDRSHPQRVSRIVSALDRHPDTKLVQTWLNEVDEAGRVTWLNRLNTQISQGQEQVYGLPERMGETAYAPHGAAMAYSRELIDAFGPLPRGVIFEDNIVNLRAELLGRALVLAEPLVDHGNHIGQVTRISTDDNPAVQMARLRLRLDSDVLSTAQNIVDLERARTWLDPRLFARLSEMYRWRAWYFERKKDALLGPWPQRLLDLAMIAPVGTRRPSLRCREIARSVLPERMFHFLTRLTRR